MGQTRKSGRMESESGGTPSNANPKIVPSNLRRILCRHLCREDGQVDNGCDDHGDKCGMRQPPGWPNSRLAAGTQSCSFLTLITFTDSGLLFSAFSLFWSGLRA